MSAEALKLALSNDLNSVPGNTNKATTDYLWSLGYRKLAAPSTEQPAGDAVSLLREALTKIEHSMRQAKIPCRDRWRELDLTHNIALSALAATERAATQPAGEVKRKVATVRVTNKGYGMALSTYIAYALPEGLHDLYAAPSGSAEPAAAASIVDFSIDGGTKFKTFLKHGFYAESSEHEIIALVEAWGAQQRESGRAEGYVDGKGLAHEIVQAIDKPINARAKAAEKERDELRAQLARPVDLSGLTRHGHIGTANNGVRGPFVLFADVQALLGQKS